MNDRDIEQELLKNLKAYTNRFEIPNSPEELSAIASSILTFQQKQGDMAIASEQGELVQRVVNQFNVNDAATALLDQTVDSTTETLVQNVCQWRQTLENQVLNTLSAYVQQFQPEQIPDLSKTILSIIPLVENAQLRKSETASLIQRVTQKFNLANALEQVVGDDSVAIAQQLSTLLQFGDLEELLKESVLGDQQFLNQPLENVTESLVNSKLAEIIGSNVLAVDIDLNVQQLMVQQVTFKLNAMQSSPPPAKSNQQIAQQVDDETARFLAERTEKLEFTNLFQKPNIP